MPFLKEAWTRINSETPIWFKKLGAASIAAGAAGVAMLGMQTGINLATPANSVAPHVPEIITTIGSHLMVAGAIGKVISAFACTTTPEPPKQ